LPRPGSRQIARPCRSKMRGVSACPPNIFQKGYENFVFIFRTGKKSCTWVHVVVSKRRKVEASNSEQKVTLVFLFLCHRMTFVEHTVRNSVVGNPLCEATYGGDDRDLPSQSPSCRGRR
jgi:hypothetical protein